MPNLVAVLVTLFVLFVPLKVIAWGSYGHQQINRSAVKLLKNTPEGACFTQNIEFMTRLAITPDYDWKSINMVNTPAELKHAKVMANVYEHPLHYFEYDAFCQPDQTAKACKLPTGDSFKGKTLTRLGNLLKGRIDYVLKMDPSKKIKDVNHPSPKEIAEHGVAPWRIKQLWNLAIEKLKTKKSEDVELALIFLGAMGHYVGDMSQPFHSSLNFDGGSNRPPATGIHHTYEECILEAEAKKVVGRKKDNWDKQKWIWTKFDGTDKEVLADSGCLVESSCPVVKPIKSKEIIEEVLNLDQSGQKYVQPLIDVFLNGNPYAKRDKNGNIVTPDHKPASTMPTESTNEGLNSDQVADSKPTPKPPDKYCDIYKDMNVNIAGQGPQTVLQSAELRMGQSSSLLAQLWVSAMKESGMDLRRCPSNLKFDMAKVINNYPLFSKDIRSAEHSKKQSENSDQDGQNNEANDPNAENRDSAPVTSGINSNSTR